jgi:hypothetical protein
MENVSFQSILQFVARAVIGYQVIKYFTSSGSQTSSTTSSHNSNPGLRNAAWKLGELTNLDVYLSSSYSNDFSNLIWSQKSIVFGDFADVREEHVTISCSPDLQNNGSLYAHFYLNGTSNGQYLYHRKLLTRYLPRKSNVAKKLLFHESDKSQEESANSEYLESEIVSYWWPNVTIHTVALDSPIGTVHPAVAASN